MPDSAKTHQMKEWPVLMSVKEVEQFLELASYYYSYYTEKHGTNDPILSKKME